MAESAPVDAALPEIEPGEELSDPIEMSAAATKVDEEPSVQLSEPEPGPRIPAAPAMPSIPLTSENLGVYFTCFTEVEAVEYALKELYRVYPDIECLLVSDGGADYAFLEASYPHLKTILDYDSRGFVPYIRLENYQEREMEDKIVDSAMEFLRRVRRAMDHSNKDYLLIMEPDALVRGPLSMPYAAHVTGSLVNELPFPELQAELMKHPLGIMVPRYGATPTILRSATFRVVHDYVLSDPHVLRRLSRGCHTFANYDILLPVVFALMGYPEVFDPQIVECLREADWEICGRPLVHQHRILYPKPGSTYTGRHADGI